MDRNVLQMLRRVIAVIALCISGLNVHAYAVTASTVPSSTDPDSIARGETFMLLIGVSNEAGDPAILDVFAWDLTVIFDPVNFQWIRHPVSDIPLVVYGPGLTDPSAASGINLSGPIRNEQPAGVARVTGATEGSALPVGTVNGGQGAWFELEYLATQTAVTDDFIIKLILDEDIVLNDNILTVNIAPAVIPVPAAGWLLGSGLLGLLGLRSRQKALHNGR